MRRRSRDFTILSLSDIFQILSRRNIVPPRLCKEFYVNSGGGRNEILRLLRMTRQESRTQESRTQESRTRHAAAAPRVMLTRFAR